MNVLVPLKMGKGGRLQKPPTYPLDKEPRQTNWSIKTDKPVAGLKYYNLASLTHFLDHSNKATVIIGRIETTALIDAGYQVSTSTEWLCKEFGLSINPLGTCHILKGLQGYPHHIKVMMKVVCPYMFSLIIMKIYYFQWFQTICIEKEYLSQLGHLLFSD